MARPKLIILAGPNGAGKTTAAKYLLHDALGVGEFVNADAIASGLSGFAPESVAIQAGRILLRRVRELISLGSSFAFETTLSSRTLRHLVREATESGYEIELIYLALPSAQVAIKRVAARVASGGHGIPEEVIERRFYRSLVNLLSVYPTIVTRWTVLDNYETPPQRIARGSRNRRTIFEADKWHQLIDQSRHRSND